MENIIARNETNAQAPMRRTWTSSAMEDALEKRNFRLIMIQAASFALFLVMSEAWNDAFQGLIQAVIPNADNGSIGLKFTNAIASSIFCLLLLGLILVVFWSIHHKRDGVSVCCCVDVV